MSSPKISIIIPVYNVEKYLKRCIDSVIGQTFDNWEAICVNDCSPDNSGAILAEYAARDKRIKVVNHAKNGGLSVARNTGLRHATGEYIMYLDSDDFLHPMAMEITHSLAVQNKSDIVSFTYGRFYRPQLMVWYKLGVNIDKIMPIGMKKKFNISKIKSITTNDVFAHVTEQTHTKIKHPIKHAQVWKFLIRREFLNGIEFIPGIVYEDLPWWMEVISRHPRVTITDLQLYYYFPNFGTSILLSYKETKKLMDRLIGLESVFKLYSNYKNAREKEIVWREFFWPFIIYSFRDVGKLDAADQDIVRKKLIEMNKLGMFENPPFPRAVKYKKRIMEFIRN